MYKKENKQYIHNKLSKLSSTLEHKEYESTNRYTITEDYDYNKDMVLNNNIL